MEGPAGSEGPKGDTGTCPASCESVPGEKGHQGPPGPVGGRGLPGVKGSMGPKGMLGDKGHMGRPGDTGTNGMKGDQGEQGVCECTDGADGADGSHGDKGTKGDKGDIGMKGELGNMGLKGDEGMMGHMGVPGPCSPAIQSAFSACINQSYPAPNWPVSFPKVLTNQQGHFNADMGIYTAPINGTYLFTFNLAVALKPLTAGLFKDHYPKVIVTALTDQSTTSQTIVLHLSMGSMVWLQVKNNYTNGMYTSYESSSTFSGYLVHPDSCEMPLGRHFMSPEPTMPGSYHWDTATTIPPP